MTNKILDEVLESFICFEPKSVVIGYTPLIFDIIAVSRNCFIPLLLDFLLLLFLLSSCRLSKPLRIQLNNTLQKRSKGYLQSLPSHRFTVLPVAPTTLLRLNPVSSCFRISPLISSGNVDSSFHYGSGTDR